MVNYKFVGEQLNNIITRASVAAEKGGNEICGLLVNNGYFIEVIETKNKIKRGGGFAFYAREIHYIESAVTILGHEILGTFHSHPMYIAQPSESDIANAVDDSLMLIIDVLDKNVGLWYIKDMKKTPLEMTII